MAKIETIGILTSGGDAPGMNAAIRAVTRAGIYNGFKVKGIYRGYDGLINGEMKDFTTENVSGIITLGGTILKTARSKEFMTMEGMQKAYDQIKANGVDALIVCGGNGSLTGAMNFAREFDVPCIGLPGTIDNDVWGTDYTIGCDTAANTAVDAINKLRDTASAHRRIMIVEVMGHTSGWLAMISGIASGAEYIIVPEVKYNIDEICEEIVESYSKGRRYSIIVVAEGACSGVGLKNVVQEKTKIDTRVSILGHIQRGGSPTMEDRMKASMLGERAALGLISGVSDVIYGFDEGKVVAINLFESVNNKKPLDPELVRLAHVLV